MIENLESGTDAGIHIIYDPATTGSHDLNQLLPGERASGLVDEIAKGTFLGFFPGGDGGTFYRIHVEQDLPDELAGRATRSASACYLRVPSGELVASGIEYLDRLDEIGRAPHFQPGHPACVTRMRIPAGNYLVESSEVERSPGALPNFARTSRTRRHSTSHRVLAYRCEGYLAPVRHPRQASPFDVPTR